MNTALKPLIPALLLSLGLTACGGGGGGASGVINDPTPAPIPAPDPTPVPPPTTDACINLDGVQDTVPSGYTAGSDGTCTLTDACLNYQGNQTLLELADKGFVRDDTTGDCRLERNHVALSTTGIDVVRMMGYTGRGVRISIVDEGFLPTHSEYADKVVGAARYVDQDTDYQLDTDEKFDGDFNEENPYHGTAVTSQAAGTKAGVAPGVALDLKSVGKYPQSQDLAIATKDVLLQQGIPVGNYSNDWLTGHLMYRSQHGVYPDETGVISLVARTSSVLVFGAGNKATDLSDTFDMVESRSADTETLFDHADEANHFLMVGAFDKEKNDLALYSNFPGYRQSFQDRFIVAGDYLMEIASDQNDMEFSVSSGTSLTSPMVAGAIAVLMEANPALTAVQAAQILLDTARQDPAWGYGTSCTVTTDLGTFTTDCGKMKFGRGLMDLPKAVEVAREM